jgi:prepilin-type N-terminal cleavage/methylation domain-containing protein
MNKSMRDLRTNRARGAGGFTLIELLVVIIILGILSAVVVFAVRGTGDKGSSAASSADVKTLRTAQEAYCARYGTYATNDAELVNKKFLSETGTLHGTRQITPGPCGGTGFVTTCNPTETGCGQNGTVADPTLAGKPTGTWTQSGDLPGGCIIAQANTTAALTNQQCIASLGNEGSLVRMNNGKVLYFAERGSAQTSCTSTTTSQPLIYPTACNPTPYGLGAATLSWKPYEPSLFVFDPATASWTKTPTPPGGQTGPAGSTGVYLPVAFGGMQVLQGTAADCGANCGKVFIRANAINAPSGTSTTSIKAPNTLAGSNPLWPNALFWLFDPVAYDASANPWTLVPDPATTDPSFILSHDGLGPTQVRNCSRTAANDCGKIMMGGGSDRAADRRGAAGGYKAPGINCTPTCDSTLDPNTTTRVAFWDPTTFNPAAPTTAAWSRAVGPYLFPNTNLSQNGTALPDGKVFVKTSAYSSIYDPVAHTWTPTANNIQNFSYKCPGFSNLLRMNHFLNPVLRPDGKLFLMDTLNSLCDASVMVPWDNSSPTDTVGSPTPAPNNAPYSSLIFDPATNQYTKSPPDPSVPNYCLCGASSPSIQLLSPLHGNRILALYADTNAPQIQSFYSADGNAPFTAVNPALSQDLQLGVAGAGYYPASVVLANGQVLVVGRNSGLNSSTKQSAQGGKESYLYTPPIP